MTTQRIDQCCGCGQFTWVGPPFIDTLVEMTNSMFEEDHIWFCTVCVDRHLDDWCEAIGGIVTRGKMTTRIWPGEFDEEE